MPDPLPPIAPAPRSEPAANPATGVPTPAPAPGPRRVADLIAAFEAFAPLALAAPWDNVGLLLGDADDPLEDPPQAGAAATAGGVLLTIDLTPAVLDEAVAMQPRPRAIVAYHPPVFEALKRVTPQSAPLLLRAARAGLAIFSPHTALDAAPGCLSDWLADGLLESGAGAGPAHSADRRALLAWDEPRPTEELKIVTFVPAGAVERVRAGLASAGAGLIGRYRVCSFATEGTGTFFGQAGTSPAVGRAGELQSVPEVRLEMVCARSALALALATLRQFHPYEEPAVDVYPLAPRPRREAGPGRKLALDRPATVATLAQRLKAYLGASVVRYALADQRPITHVGVCPGAGASLMDAARAQGCEVFVTGEMKHHEVLAALRQGVSVILAGHTRTERGYLPRLRDRLAAALPGLRVEVSRADVDPLLAV